MTSSAIIGTTLEVASGQLKVRAQGITSNELAANSVVTAAITDLNVTTAKIANSNVTTAKIADSNVTTAKIADSNVTTAKIANADITAAKLSGAQTGTAPVFGVRAWASVNSTGSTKRSQNIQSITKPSTGNYTVNFSLDMPASTYAIVTTTESTGSSDTFHAEFYDKSSGSFKIRTSKRDTSGDRASVDADFDFMVLG
jgi:hypothetical protein